MQATEVQPLIIEFPNLQFPFQIDALMDGSTGGDPQSPPALDKNAPKSLPPNSHGNGIL
jgi:hypothetical protein